MLTGDVEGGKKLGWGDLWWKKGGRGDLWGFERVSGLLVGRARVIIANLRRSKLSKSSGDFRKKYEKMRLGR